MEFLTSVKTLTESLTESLPEEKRRRATAVEEGQGGGRTLIPKEAPGNTTMVPKSSLGPSLPPSSDSLPDCDQYACMFEALIDLHNTFTSVVVDPSPKVEVDELVERKCLEREFLFILKQELWALNTGESRDKLKCAEFILHQLRLDEGDYSLGVDAFAAEDKEAVSLGSLSSDISWHLVPPNERYSNPKPNPEENEKKTNNTTATNKRVLRVKDSIHDLILDETQTFGPAEVDQDQIQQEQNSFPFSFDDTEDEDDEEESPQEHQQEEESQEKLSFSFDKVVPTHTTDQQENGLDDDDVDDVDATNRTNRTKKGEEEEPILSLSKGVAEALVSIQQTVEENDNSAGGVHATPLANPNPSDSHPHRRSQPPLFVLESKEGSMKALVDSSEREAEPVIVKETPDVVIEIDHRLAEETPPLDTTASLPPAVATNEDVPPVDETGAERENQQQQNKLDVDVGEEKGREASKPPLAVIAALKKKKKKSVKISQKQKEKWEDYLQRARVNESHIIHGKRTRAPPPKYAEFLKQNNKANANTKPDTTTATSRRRSSSRAGTGQDHEKRNSAPVQSNRKRQRRCSAPGPLKREKKEKNTPTKKQGGGGSRKRPSSAKDKEDEKKKGNDVFSSMEFLLTRFSSEQEKKICQLVESHGGQVVEDIPQAVRFSSNSNASANNVVVVAKDSKGTLKRLFGYCANHPIVKEEWLHQCVRHKYPVEMKRHLVHYCPLEESEEQKKRLFDGKRLLLVGDEQFVRSGRNSFQSVLEHGGAEVSTLLSRVRVLSTSSSKKKGVSSCIVSKRKRQSLELEGKLAAVIVQNKEDLDTVEADLKGLNISTILYKQLIPRIMGRGRINQLLLDDDDAQSDDDGDGDHSDSRGNENEPPQCSIEEEEEEEMETDLAEETTTATGLRAQSRKQKTEAKSDNPTSSGQKNDGGDLAEAVEEDCHEEANDPEVEVEVEERE
jgi:hypothetical protein